MLYILMLFTAYLSCSHVPEPVRAVNFTRKPNACYSASAFQALIAIPAWRSYIVNYPCTDMQNYDTELLKGLQNLIIQYTHAANSFLTEYDMDAFDTMLCQKKIIIVREESESRPFHDALTFINKLNQSLSATDQCNFFDLFMFHQTHTIKDSENTRFEYVSEHRLLAMSSSGKQSLLELLKNSSIKTIHGTDGSVAASKSTHLTSLPLILCIEFGLGPEFQKQPLRSVEIQTHLNVQELIKTGLRTSLGPVDYELMSIIWQAHNHVRAYVKYNKIWYVCDDLYPSCEIVRNYTQDFNAGYLKNFHGYDLFYPIALFYQQVQPTADEPSLPLTELQSSLELLSIS